MKPDRKERRQRDLGSVRALRGFLLAIIESPEQYLQNADLSKMLRSQSALADFESEPLGIRGMSLNHQKALAILVFGNYELLDEVRRRALDALEQERDRKKTRTREGSKAALRASGKVRECELTNLREDLVLIQRAYDLRCIQARNYAERGGPATIALCNKEQREIDTTLSSLRNRLKPGGTVSVLRKET